MKTWRHPEAKAEMPAGPWQDEPDKAVWIDAATDLDCMIQRGPSGALCGYVGVGPDHPWHRVGYGDCLSPACEDDCCYEHSPDSIVDVHGGLTYAAACDESATEDHGICHVPEPGRTHDVWWFGFDCAHTWDIRPASMLREQRLSLPPIPGGLKDVYRDFAYVTEQVTSLAKQIAEVGR